MRGILATECLDHALFKYTQREFGFEKLSGLEGRLMATKGYH